MTQFVDTHCHIHDVAFFPEDRDSVYARAVAEDVAMICVGTSQKDSWQAVEFAQSRAQTWAAVGVHPHDSSEGVEQIGMILHEKHEKVVGIGEIGLDYYYLNSTREQQIAALEQQLQWAIDYSLPVCFHVRDSKTQPGAVWDDFWPIVDNFSGVQGLLHSFSDTRGQLERGLSRDFAIGVNGISTFTKNAEQQAMFASIPLDKMMLETDAPFLTPVPFRGRINEPSFVGRVAEHMATVLGVSLDLVSASTTANAERFFGITTGTLHGSNNSKPITE